MLNIFRKNPKQAEPLPALKTPAAVPYDPGLVTALTHQHRSLTLLLVKASSAAQQGLYEEIKETLQQFKHELAEHLKRETTELHPYLSAHLKGDGSKEILKEMRASTTNIERTLEGLINHYASYPVTERNVARFEIELSGVSDEFCAKLEQEEASIYTLYLTPEAY